MAHNDKSVRFNRIKELSIREDVPSWLLAIYLDVVPATITSWNKNKSQPNEKQFKKIRNFYRVNLNQLVVKTEPPGHMHLANAMKMAAAQFEKKHGSAYEVKVSKNGNESKTLHRKLKTLLRDIVEQYEKNGTLPR